jgi:hypothetical protein
MPKYIIKWDAGYGEEFEEVEAENEKAATICAYECWKDDIESTAKYSTVGISSDKLKEECGI